MDTMDWRPLIEEWLEDARKAAVAASRQPNGSRYKLRVYERALTAVRAVDAPVTDPRELLPLAGIGDKTVAMLGSKMKQHCKKNGVPLPPSLEPAAPAPSFDPPPKDVNGLRQSFPFAPPPKRSTGRVYVPKYGSAPYHVLIGMRVYELADESQQGIGQSELTRQIKSRTAGALEGAVSRSSPSIGAALKTLRDHDCVYIRNSRYFLDEKGRELADGFLHAEGAAEAVLVTAPRASRDPSAVEAAAPGLAPNTFTSEKWPAGSYSVKLVLDNREVASRHDRTGLIDDLKATGIAMDVQALCVGDALWVAEHTQSRRRAVLDYIVERKTLPDLRASIHDGRYHEQKKRLAKSTLPHVVYLIEQPNNAQNNELYRENRQKFDTALSQTMAMHKFHLKQSRSQNDTVLYLSTLTTTLAREYDACTLEVVVPNVTTFEASMRAARAQAAPGVGVGIDFSSFDESLRKSKLMTIGDTFRAMLRAIKGISAEKAMSIQRAYPTPAHLIRAYAEQPSEEAAKQMVYEATKHCATRQQIRPALSALVFEVWHP